MEGQGENDEQDKPEGFHHTESDLEQGVVFQEYQDHDIDQPAEEEQRCEELVDRPILLKDRFSIELSNAATRLHRLQPVSVIRDSCHGQCRIVCEQDHKNKSDEGYQGLGHRLILQTIDIHEGHQGDLQVQLCNHTNDHVVPELGLQPP